MPRQSTLTSGSILFDGSSKMASSTSFIALLLTCLLTHSPKLSHHPRPSTSHLNLDSTMLEEECWRSKCPGVIHLCHPYYPIYLTIYCCYTLLHSNSLAHYCLCAHLPDNQEMEKMTKPTAAKILGLGWSWWACTAPTSLEVKVTLYLGDGEEGSSLLNFWQVCCN